MTKQIQVAEPSSSEARSALRERILLKLASMGFSIPKRGASAEIVSVAEAIFARYAEQKRLLRDHRAPIDARLENFLEKYLKEAGEAPITFPRETLILDEPGIARELSIPDGENEYRNSEVSSYRLDNGVLHNPTSDRRTTEGVFHIADVGFKVPADKFAVPLVTYLRLLRAALSPPEELAILPFSANYERPTKTLVSLYLRPLVSPAVAGYSEEKRSEIRFFVPGGLVSNLDFVESIFGTAGDPELPENDAALDPLHFTGHSGAVILAPHLRKLTKKELGLPRASEASERQKREGMCYEADDELYNGGRAFKIALRDPRGVMITILADNYFGYCKKEVKTQIGFSANLLGLAEEEHSGGAVAFPAHALGHHFSASPERAERTLVAIEEAFGEAFERDGEVLTSRRFPEVHVLPADTVFDARTQRAAFRGETEEKSLRILPGHHYFLPNGYRIRLERQGGSKKHELVGVSPNATVCHKPCTVSGGGKSEISKSLGDAIDFGPIYVGDFATDMSRVREIIGRDYGEAILPERRANEKSASRSLLGKERSLGSVIKLLTANDHLYTEAHNAYVASIPPHVKAIVFAIKRHYSPEWGDDYEAHFSVDSVNDAPGHELKLDGVRLSGSYLRVGHEGSGFRMFKLRQDFVAADKVQTEDDITASIVVPRSAIPKLPEAYSENPSVKISENCEYRLFQRPDDAIIPGYDSQTEIDMASPGLFASNFEPLDAKEVEDLLERADQFAEFSEPMRAHLERAAKSPRKNVCSAHPRLVSGKPSKNPRYLQVRPDLAAPIGRFVAETATRLARGLDATEQVLFPVSSVLSGRRNNPPDSIGGKKVRPLCVFGPIHYQELPELFMDYICSVTGKSPSTTGAGSEGALTKGPFNALPATADLNNALLGLVLGGYGGFSTAAGYIGPKYRVDHDISLLVPEIWCRLSVEERDPKRMIERGELEAVNDFEFEGRTIPASRLGFRISERFVHRYLGRIFDAPTRVFPADMLAPERQDLATYVDGIENIADAQRRAALEYFEDGTIEYACPPLRALLHVMAYGTFEGKTPADPAFRALFSREVVLGSDYYRERLERKKRSDVAHFEKHLGLLREFEKRPGYENVNARIGLGVRLAEVERELARVSAPDYVGTLEGTLGLDPLIESR